MLFDLIMGLVGLAALVAAGAILDRAEMRKRMTRNAMRAMDRGNV